MIFDGAHKGHKPWQPVLSAFVLTMALPAALFAMLFHTSRQSPTGPSLDLFLAHARMGASNVSLPGYPVTNRTRTGRTTPTPVAAPSALTIKTGGPWPADGIGPYCTLVSPLVKMRPHIRPAAPPAGGPARYNFTIARNEYESFQVVCVGAMTGVAVQLAMDAPPAASSGISWLGHSTLNYLARTPSDCEAEVGLHPDILVPFVDPWFNETRHATSVVPLRSTASWWFDAFASPATAAGEYTGRVLVTADGNLSLALPFALRVRNLTLPDTSPFPTAFLFWAWPGATTYDMEWATELALMHRVSVPVMLAWALEDAEPLQWDAFMERWGGYLHGKKLPFGLANTTVTSLAMPPGHCATYRNGTCSEEDTAKTVSFWRRVWEKFDSVGLSHLLFDYTVDEPEMNDAWDELEARAAVVKQAAPGLRTLATASIEQAWRRGDSGSVDLWVPLVTDVAVKDGCFEEWGNRRGYYAGLNISRDSLWWYQSCDTHGCGGGCMQVEANDSDWSSCRTGYPSYMIDHSMVKNRIFPWASYAYDMGGELYWGLTFASVAGDAWESQWIAGGNGDGNLLYRGTPARIGGNSEVPLASVRLKAIRDGQEDYLYMGMAEARVGRAAVMGVIGEVLTSAYVFSEDPERMAAVRERLGDIAEFGVRGTFAAASNSTSL